MAAAPPNRARRRVRLAALAAGLLVAAAGAYALLRPTAQAPVVEGDSAEPWVEALKVPEQAARAATELKALGPRAFPALGKLLADPSYTVRWRALTVLRDTPGDLSVVRDDVGRALSASAEPAERIVLLNLVERMGRAGAPLAPQVVARLAADEPGVRRYAWRALAKTGAPADLLVPKVESALAAEAPELVVDPLRCLEALGDEARPAVPALERWLLALPATLDEPVGTAEATAMRVLAGLAGHDAPARAVLERLGVEAGPERAARAMAGLIDVAGNDPARHRELAALLRAPDGSVRLPVLQALTAEPARTRPLLPVLLALLPEASPAARAVGAAAIGRLGPEGVTAIPTLVVILVQGGPDADVRRALEGLGEAAPEALAEALPAQPGQGLDELVAIAQGLLPRLAPAARAKLWTRLTTWWLDGATSPTPGGEESLAILLAGLGSREPEVTERLVPALDTGTPVARERAAQLLGRLPGQREVLVKRLESPDAGQRRAALIGLARGRSEDDPAERELHFKALDDAAPDVREEALVLLLAVPDQERTARLSVLGTKVVGILTEMLGRSTPARRRLAAGAFRRFPEASPEAVAALGAALRSEDADLRRIALEVLNQVRQPLGPAADGLVALLESTEPAQAVQLLQLVGRAGPAAKGATPRLVALFTKGPDINLQPAVLQALGKIDPPTEAALPLLRAGLSSSDEGVRQAAVGCAAALVRGIPTLPRELFERFVALQVEIAASSDKKPRPQSETQLLQMLASLGSTAPDLRVTAQEIARTADAENRPHVLAALHALAVHNGGWKVTFEELAADENLRADIAAAMMRSPYDPAIDLVKVLSLEEVVTLLADTRPDVRRRAAQALATTPESLATEAERIFEALGNDETAAMRSLLFKMLPRLGPAATRAGPALVKALQAPTSPLGTTALEALRALDLPPETLSALLRTCLAESGPARLSVLDRIARMGSSGRSLQPDVLELVRDLRSEHVPGARRASELPAALQALAAVGKDLPGTWSTVAQTWGSKSGESEQLAIAEALAALAPLPEEDVALFLSWLPGAPATYATPLARAVGQLGARGEAGVPWLIERIRAGSPSSRESAAWALSRMGKPAGAALPILLELLGKGQGTDWVMTALHHLSTEDPGAFLAGVARAPAAARWQLVNIVGTRLEAFLALEQGPAIAQTLLPLVLDPAAGLGASQQDMPWRTLLAALPHAPAVLAQLLDEAAKGDGTPRTQRAVALSAASPEARSAAIARLASGSTQQRLGGLAVVGHSSVRQWSPEELGAITARLEDSERTVRWRAGEVLLADGRPGITILQQLDDVTRTRVGRVALEVLEASQGEEHLWALHVLWTRDVSVPDGGPRLARMLLTQDEKRVGSVAGALKVQGVAAPEPVRAVLEPELASGDELRRVRAVYGWATMEFESTRVEPLLPPLLAATDPQVRQCAANACTMLWTSCASCRPALLTMLRDPERTLRLRAAEVLVHVAQADAEVVKTLRAVIFDPTVEGREELLDPLTHVGELAVPILIEGLDEKALRSKCLSALSSSLLRGKAKAALPRLERMLVETPEKDADQRRFIQIVIDSVRGG